MPAISATAPGKIILFGEHAVVYNRPAIAIPFMGVQARAMILANPLGPSNQVRIEAKDIGFDQFLDQLDPRHPFAISIQGVKDFLRIERLPAMHIRINSTIPVAAGMGSSAAVAVAIVRALSQFIGHPLDNDTVNAIAFKVEEQLHGTPSGVDNTVITFAKPVYFSRVKPLEFLSIKAPIDLIIADSGQTAATGPMVEGVRRRRLKDPELYDTLFNRIEALVDLARNSLETGSSENLGTLMNNNHEILQSMGVSTLELDTLVQIALATGATGAKLTGGGGGGNIVALAPAAKVEIIKDALLGAGARQVWQTRVAADGGSIHD